MKRIPIIHTVSSILTALILISFIGCSKVSEDAVELTVDFTWEGFVPCSQADMPEIRITGIPDSTTVLVVSLNDHGLSHGQQSFPYKGSGIIKKGSLNQIEAPCPIGDPGKYKFTVEALDENKVIIGIGSRERFYPEKK